VNWDHRDLQLAREVRSAADVLKGLTAHPIQVTVATIGRTIGHLALLQQHLDKLPATARALAEVTETREDFALRRIQWATTTYLQEQRYPQPWEFIRRAGLERVSMWPTVEGAIHAALQTLKQHLIEGAIPMYVTAPSKKG
jgi:hypothetical protein